MLVSSNCAYWKEDMESWVKQINKSKNEADRYIEEINELKQIFKENEFGVKKYQKCSLCPYVTQSSACPLTWRRLHRKIPLQPANYLQDLAEFYATFTAEQRTPVR